MFDNRFPYSWERFGFTLQKPCISYLNTYKAHRSLLLFRKKNPNKPQCKPARPSMLAHTVELNLRSASKDLVSDVKKIPPKSYFTLFRSGALLTPKVHGAVSTLPDHTWNWENSMCFIGLLCFQELFCLYTFVIFSFLFFLKKILLFYINFVAWTLIQTVFPFY